MDNPNGIKQHQTKKTLEDCGLKSAEPFNFEAILENNNIQTSDFFKAIKEGAKI